MHWSIADLGKWLKSVIAGHCRYYGVPWNGKSLTRFKSEIIRMWCKSLRRGSQKHRITWGLMNRIAKRWLPCSFLSAILIHWNACASILEAGAQCISSASWGLYGGGCRVIGIPTLMSAD
ncbi:MAG: hypothetical protein MRK01_15735 [Candidatus Scalindua sp.]|nr:hypothetical protein [Candidatus Scalindua sp.]